MRFSLLRLTALCGATFLAIGCQEGIAPSPTDTSVRSPRISAALAPVAPGSAIVLDQQTGTLSETGSELAKGFNLPNANPHLGDAVVATFFWTGTATITSVTDFQTDANRTPIGNIFHLVESVSAGGVSMATYVATNVQGYPDPAPNPTIVYAVRATLSGPVSDGGIMISAYSGVAPVFTNAFGGHSSGSGASSSATVSDAGQIPINAGAVAYGVTMANALVGRDPPPGYTPFPAGSMSDNVMVAEGDYLVASVTGTTDPRWTWGGFSQPSTWLASVLSLNPPPHLVFTAPPKTTLPLVTMPAVQVTVTDASGNAVTGFTGTVTIAIGHNGGTVTAGTLSGTTTVAVVNGVATFSDLSIDQLGNGYTLVVTAGGTTGAESAPFNIGAF
jgi:hypothetical protein